MNLVVRLIMKCEAAARPDGSFSPMPRRDLSGPGTAAACGVVFTWVSQRPVMKKIKNAAERLCRVSRQCQLDSTFGSRDSDFFKLHVSTQTNQTATLYLILVFVIFDFFRNENNKLQLIFFKLFFCSVSTLSLACARPCSFQARRRRDLSRAPAT